MSVYFFSGPPPTLAASRLSHPGPSWADRVKCSQSVTNANQPTASVGEKLGKKLSLWEDFFSTKCDFSQQKNVFVACSSSPSPCLIKCLMCLLGKKDAEGWETVQRGRTAKPRSATLHGKVCPDLAHAAPKRERPKCEQPHPPPQEKQLSHTQCPVTEDATIPDNEQKVLAEPNPAEKVGSQENGDMMEVLGLSTL